MRKQLQARIGALNAARERYVAERHGKETPAADSLDTVMAKALRAQAASRGMQVE